jgi:5'(3')-deoxyribonucleotidase
MKPLVLLDCDGILADYVGSVLDFVEKNTGSRPSRESITGWHVWDSIQDKALEEAFEKHACSLGFCDEIRPFDEALRGFPLLEQIADVHIVTSPYDGNPTWTHERETWLKRYFGVERRRVHHINSKHLTRGDYLVDDKPKNVREWLLNRRDHYLGHGILWDTPHNRLDEGFWRVHSWQELVTIVSSPPQR